MLRLCHNLAGGVFTDPQAVSHNREQYQWTLNACHIRYPEITKPAQWHTIQERCKYHSQTYSVVLRESHGAFTHADIQYIFGVLYQYLCRHDMAAILTTWC